MLKKKNMKKMQKSADKLRCYSYVAFKTTLICRTQIYSHFALPRSEYYKTCMPCVQLTPKIWAYYDVPNLLHGRLDGRPLSITMVDLIRSIIGFAIRKHPWLTLLMSPKLNRTLRVPLESFSITDEEGNDA